MNTTITGMTFTILLQPFEVRNLDIQATRPYFLNNFFTITGVSRVHRYSHHSQCNGSDRSHWIQDRLGGYQK